jgi:predicted AAA+ superfamily ATPase
MDGNLKEKYFNRLLKPPDRSFFLFGPRGVGKSTWLKMLFPNSPYFDLLDQNLQMELSANPANFEAGIAGRKDAEWIVIDEIQKLPFLLEEVHRLIEKKHWKFILCGSSARKLRRGGVNLLAGRALTRNLDAFVSAELGEYFDLDFSLNWGNLPLVQCDRDYAGDILASYLNTYIKEEIKEESIVRSLPPFFRFLGITGLLNGQTVNGQNIAREASVPRSNVDVYFSILEDSLLGYFLPAYRPRLKVREQAHPKFYWFDPGVARAAAGLLNEPLGKEWLGIALETLIFSELRAYNHTSGKNRDIFFYRTNSGMEIDFIIETGKKQQSTPSHVICMEIKSSAKWQRMWGKAIRSFKTSGIVQVDRMIGVYMGDKSYIYDDFEVMPVLDFLASLHKGEIF